MGNQYCEGQHTPGEPFEDSGNVYCKVCGEFLSNINEFVAAAKEAANTRHVKMVLDYEASHQDWESPRHTFRND